MLTIYKSYLEVLSNGVHDPGLPLKVKLKLDLSSELIHG